MNLAEEKNKRLIACISCSGSGETYVSGIRYAEGHKGPYSAVVKCSRCKGKRLIPAMMNGWILRGTAIRCARMKRKFTLIKEAERRGISLVELSDIERGMVDNSSVEIE